MVNLDTVCHVCICGTQMWRLDWVIFDDYEIAAHSLNMTCISCGATALAPTLPDKPDDGHPAYM